MRGGDWGGGWEWAAMIGRESGNGRWGLGGRVGMEGSDWEGEGTWIDLTSAVWVRLVEGLSQCPRLWKPVIPLAGYAWPQRGMGTCRFGGTSLGTADNRSPQCVPSTQMLCH